MEFEVDLKEKDTCPDWCGSVGWASSYEPKGHQFHSGQGTYLDCRPGPQLEVCERPKKKKKEKERKEKKERKKRRTQTSVLGRFGREGIQT